MCKGDSGLIHVNCLRKWIEKDLSVSELTDFQTNYVYAKLTCEVCKGVYPDIFKHKGEIFALYNFERPSDSDYIVIQVIGQPNGKNFAVIKIPVDYTVEVGNKNQEVSIPSSCLDSFHATLTYVSKFGELILNEQNSARGTSILI